MNEWKLVPVAPTQAMLDAAGECPVPEGKAWLDDDARATWGAMLAAAPEPPHTSMTRGEAAAFQNWRGMDGACAFHLIERHAEGWGDVARMMEAWLEANREQPNHNMSGA